jgi:TolB-like protein/Flp pilus assembly protein TadD/predicted Ser/Thr protein kinase
LRGRYALERELGRGGMATVYLAQDIKHERPVALKVLRPALAMTMGPDRFRREITTAARLQHPHILSVHDSGETEGLLWYTMPYVRGESLRDRLKREGRLPLSEALRITSEAGRALDYAHREGVIHRDIKPENILLTLDGDTLVADFGIARAVGSPSESRLTQAGLALGTPAYMAPEQATGERGVDARTDQYSLAVVCYEMLVGRPPFEGTTGAAIIARRFTAPMPAVRAQRPEVPEATERALERAMALDPANRFASVAEFVRALGAATATPAAGVPSIPESATDALATPDAPPSPRPWLAPRVLVPGALALVAALVVGGIALRSGATSGRGDAAANTRLAVLPFDNLGDSANAYFADGMADAIRGKLTQLDRLQVIARESSVEYRGSTKSPQEIGKELGARYLLTGTVRWARANDGTSRVEVSPELVDLGAGAAPTSRWQESFDASPTDVFKVQSDIAGKVADALDVALGAGEQDAMRQRPTENLPAYNAYLQGEAIRAESGDLASVRLAIARYENAVKLDPAFALAWARLAGARTILYTYGAPDPALGRAARDALDHARSLAPATPATATAEWSVQLGLNHDPAAALAAVEPALAEAPNDATLLRLVAEAEIALGRLEPAREHATRAVALDPRTPLTFVTLGDVDARLGRWDDVRATFERALSSARVNVVLISRGIEARLLMGDLDGAHRMLAQTYPTVDHARVVAFAAGFRNIGWSLDEGDRRLVLSLPVAAFDGNAARWTLVRAEMRAWSGDTAGARVLGDSAARLLRRQLGDAPRDASLHADLGLGLAYAGRFHEAIAEGERGVELMPVARDFDLGSEMRFALARILVRAGERDRAIVLLEPLARRPYYLSPAWLRIDPNLAPLRGDPRFERLAGGK